MQRCNRYINLSSLWSKWLNTENFIWAIQIQNNRRTQKRRKNCVWMLVKVSQRTHYWSNYLLNFFPLFSTKVSLFLRPCHFIYYIFKIVTLVSIQYYISFRCTVWFDIYVPHNEITALILVIFSHVQTLSLIHIWRCRRGM